MTTVGRKHFDSRLRAQKQIQNDLVTALSSWHCCGLRLLRTGDRMIRHRDSRYTTNTRPNDEWLWTFLSALKNQ